MNELQAAYGLIQLRYVDEYIAKRKAIANFYRQKLNGIPGICFLNDIIGIKHNYTYFPILVDVEKFGQSRDDVYERLKGNNIYGRRYFYPLISQFPFYNELPSAKSENLVVATNISGQVICLPMFPDLDFKIVQTISKLLINK
jgi:dTDP-4-amino-4,6-dideoxygalactose transaminase